MKGAETEAVIRGFFYKNKNENKNFNKSSNQSSGDKQGYTKSNKDKQIIVFVQWR